MNISTAPAPRIDESGQSGLRDSIELLWNRKFGTFWIGSLLSNIGTWMQQVAEPWLILSLSGSPLLLGIDAFAMDAPGWALTLFGGILADRADRRRTIFIFQAIQMLCPIGLIVLILTGWIHVWMIIALSLIVGITDALSMPSFQSVIPTMVESKQIGNALALNSTQFNLSRILGPAFAGIVMARYGPVGCFGTNTMSYIPLLLCVYWAIPKTNRRLKSFEAPGSRESLFSEIRAIGRNPKLRGALLTVLMTSILCGPLVTFSPVLIKQVFRSDVSHFGGALAAFGIGGLLGGIIILSMNGRVNRIKLCSGFATFYGVVIVATSLNHSLLGLDALLILAGAALTISNTSANSILQSSVQDRIRGQTASLYMLAMRGGLSLGSLIAGVTVTYCGVNRVFLINGALAIVIQPLIYRRWQSSRG